MAYTQGYYCLETEHFFLSFVMKMFSIFCCLSFCCWQRFEFGLLHYFNNTSNAFVALFIFRGYLALFSSRKFFYNHILSIDSYKRDLTNHFWWSFHLFVRNKNNLGQKSSCVNDVIFVLSPHVTLWLNQK